MNAVLRSGVICGTIGFAIGMGVSAIHCRPEVALVRALLAALVLGLAGILASSLNQAPRLDDESGGLRNEDTT